MRNSFSRTSPAQRIVDKFPEHPVLGSVLIFILYFILGESSYTFVLKPMNNSVFWLPSGLAAFFFIYFRNRMRLWPPLLISVFLSEFVLVRLKGVPLMPALIWGVANLALCLTIGGLAKRAFPTDFSFRRVKDVSSFFLLCFFAVIPGGLIAGAGTLLMDVEGSFFFSALAWSLSDALGIMLLGPIFLSWISFTKPFSGSRGEGIVLGVSLALFSWFVIFVSRDHVIDRSHFSFLVLFAAWGAIRFGARGLSLILLAVDLVEVYATMQGSGTFANVDLPPYERLLILQLLVVNIGVLLYILASALEEQSELRVEAETATNVRDEFISIVSHELKTPLTALTMDLQMLTNLIRSGRIQEESLAKLGRLADIGDREIHRLSSLVDDLLDASRATMGQMRIDPGACELRRIVEEASERLSPALRDSGSSLSVTGEERLNGVWDHQRIGQVVTNLLSNAIKYGKGSPIEVRIERKNNRALVSVTDHGPGISEEDQAKVFERFERFTTDSGVPGLGLGLYISKIIAEAHGGILSLKSEKNSETTFTLELPVGN